MTRSPDPKSKNTAFKPKTTEDFRIIEDFKRLAIQDGIELHDLYVEAFHLIFNVHHWPPGNPQLTLERCQQTKIVSLGKCGISKCPFKAITIGLNLLSKKEHRFCKKHYETLPQRHDPKVWKFNSETENR